MKKLAIIGSGDLGQQIAYYAINDNQYEVVGFFDDTKKEGSKVNNIPILGGISSINTEYIKKEFDVIVIGIGYKHMEFRKELYTTLSRIIPFGKCIHSTVYIEKTAKIGNGTIIFPNSIIDHNVILKNNILINIGCSISHDTVLNNHSFLSPRVAIAGFCKIGEQNIIGINSTIIDNIKTIKNTQIGGGAVVLKNIIKAGLYVGNPLRFIR